jgi:hypothetical protein
MPPVNFKRLQRQNNMFDFGVHAMVFVSLKVTRNKRECIEYDLKLQ